VPERTFVFIDRLAIQSIHCILDLLAPLIVDRFLSGPMITIAQ